MRQFMLINITLACVGLALGCMQQTMPISTPNVERQANNPIPILAYYYIWFDPNSWERAKIDYPLLGRYSSSDANVMRQHIVWAKAAGLSGFIVSWKSTDTLNQRLAKLAELAAAEDFKLLIIYQGLDFNRQPLPVRRIADDLDYFISHYADHQTFDLFDKPVVIWSGTWMFTREEVKQVAQGRRERLRLLASERNLEGYLRLADVVDGNAYYWSSVNPDTYKGYAGKLDSLGQAVHARHGLWIAPAAPGFDARLIGGKTVVERKNGETLRYELNAALKSSPDAVGLISWNEFSENTHIEPSQQYGRRYLDAIAAIQNMTIPDIPDFDSSDPGDTLATLDGGRVIALGLLVMLVVGSMVLIARRWGHHAP